VAHRLADLMNADARVAVGGALVREADGSVQASARRFPGVTTAWGGRTSVLSRMWPANPLTRRNLVLPTRDGRAAEVDWIAGSCMMVRRAAFVEVGGMDERFFLYWEDADFCLRVRRRGWTVMYYPVPGVTHLTGRSSNAHPVRSLVAFHQSAYRYFVKHSGPIGRLAAPVVYVGLQVRLLFKIALSKVRA
jgi:GT2 family glycosyltransferase